MIIGIPKEIKAEENRVAITPAGVSALVAHGHRVLIERDAGAGSGLADAQYRAAGARVLRTARQVWQRCRDDSQGQGAAARRVSLPARGPASSSPTCTSPPARS